MLSMGCGSMPSSGANATGTVRGQIDPMSFDGGQADRYRRRSAGRASVAVLAVAALLTLAACSNSKSDSSGSADGSPDSSTETFGGSTTTTTPIGSTVPGGLGAGDATGVQGNGPGGAITLLARTEVKRTARELAKAFQASQPGSRVQLTLDSGSGILARIRSGEQPDIVLDSRKHLNALSEENRIIWRPIEFATQEPVIVVAVGNPKHVRSLASFGADPASTSAVCAPDRNCGKTALILFSRATIKASPDVTLPGATAVVNAMKAGTVDVAILDGPKAANRSTIVQAVAIPASINLISTHWQLSSASDSEGAGAFSDFMFSAAGSGIVAKRGLRPPTT